MIRSRTCRASMATISSTRPHGDMLPQTTAGHTLGCRSRSQGRVRSKTSSGSLNYEVNCPLWGPWLEVLARRHTLIRYDGRGSGLSDWHANDFSLDRCIEDLEAVVDSSKINQFALFGTTIGAITAL